MSKQFEIKYHNKVFKENNSIIVDDLNDAKNRIKSMKKLFEIENIRLFEIKELKID